MKFLFAVVCAAACVIGPSAGFAAKTGVGRGPHLGILNGSGVGSAQRLRMRGMQNRIPAPLPPPPQVPVINGSSVGPNGLPPMGGAR
jgi:hypothetical protein